ncbi:MAG: glycoside hydrolase family 31 protein [Polyangiaceae bacterium]
MRSALGLAATLLLSCDVGPQLPPPAPKTLATITSGTATLTFDSAGTLALSRGDTTLLRVDRSGFVLGTLEVTNDLTYDPYPIAVASPLYVVPDDLVWAAPTASELVSATNDALQIRLTYPAGTALLAATAGPAGTFDLKLVPDHPERVGFVRLAAHANEKEGFYGLGEVFDDVNHRGKIRAMQLEQDGTTESSTNEAHVPIPLLIGTRGWALFIDDPHPGVFEVATTEPTLVQATYGTGVDSARGLAFHLFSEPEPLDLTKHYYDLTGYPRLPAPWALGPLVWRDENDDQAQVVSDLEVMRTLDLPATGVWIDRPYATGVNTFDFDAAKFPDPDAMIALAHALGFHMGLWHTPYLDESDPSTATLRSEALAANAYPAKSGLQLNKWGDLLDLTRPSARAFWGSHIARYTAHGIDGFKLDYGEDVVVGITAERLPWSFSDGSDERTMHERYQLAYHSTYADVLRPNHEGPDVDFADDGWFLLCRHSTVGDQANAPIIWPGDLDASFAKWAEHVDEDGESYVAVGGLPASVIGGLGLGASGFPFYGADTGGYRHSPPDKELFTRWFEQTALSTVMQIGNSANTVAWEPDEATGYDGEMLRWYRDYTRLHLRLFPYVWSLAHRLAVDGRAIQRPLGLAFPSLGVHPNDEYMLGDGLLVAPVLERGKTSRAVIFPPGSWVNFFDATTHRGEEVEGGTSESVDAPLDVLPLYLREGAIVPMLRPTIDTLSPTTTPAVVDSFATAPGELWVRVVGGPKTSFEVFDGTLLEQEGTDASVTIAITPGTVFREGAIFTLDGLGGPPGAITIDGTTLKKSALSDIEGHPTSYAIDEAGRVIVHLQPGPHVVVVSRAAP